MSATLQYMQQRLHEKHDSLAAEMEMILENLNRMDELLKCLVEFTGPERPHVEYQDIPRTLSQVLTFVAKEAEGRKVTIHTDFERNVPPCLADHRKLKQVFLNLFKNALEAMPEGGRLSVRVTLVRHAAAAQRPVLSIEVSDTGIGIPEGDLDAIFRPFYSTKKGGTGLGLPFCRRVIEEHGGEISVQRQRGRGTAVTLRLPMTPPGREEDEPAQDHLGDRRR
jgi:signal transduction histidine kinase